MAANVQAEQNQTAGGGPAHISRRSFVQGLAGATAAAILPPVQAASVTVPPAHQAPSEFMPLFEDCDGYWGNFVMAIGRHDADPTRLAEELLDEMIERDDPASVVPEYMVIHPDDPSDYSSEFKEEFRPAAIAHIAASFRQGWGRWGCKNRGEYDECKGCTQSATGNDLLCGGEADDNPPLFDTCSPDAPGAAPYLILGAE